VREGLDPLGCHLLIPMELVNPVDMTPDGGKDTGMRPLDILMSSSWCSWALCAMNRFAFASADVKK